MTSPYARIIDENLRRLFQEARDQLDNKMPWDREGNSYSFRAFGEQCTFTPEGIWLGGQRLQDAVGVIISLYTLHASASPVNLYPLKAYKEFANTMPYAGAFATHTEAPLVPHVESIYKQREMIYSNLQGEAAGFPNSGDFAFLVQPLPNVYLGYIFYLPDDDFPAAVTCLFSNNADQFLPPDAMADVGEYTSKRMIALLNAQPR